MKKLFLLMFFLGSHFETALAASPLTLTEYLKSVAAQSPEMQIEDALAKEASARARGIRLNPPMVGVMNMKDAGGNNQGLEVSQEIPFPTKITQEHKVRQFESEAQKANSQYRKNETLLMARNAYFEFWQAFEKARIIKEKRDWLKTHSKIARSAARSDSAAQLHFLGSESEVDLLENETLEAEAKLAEKRNTLQVFAPDLSLDERIPEEPALESLEPQPKSKSALLSWRESELKVANADLSLNRQTYLPDLFVRLRNYSGNEMAPRSEEVMVGITLPFVYFWQPQAASSAAAARSQRAQAELKKTQVELTSRLSSLMQRADALRKQLTILREKLLPRAHKRMKLATNLSQRTMEGLSEHRDVMLEYMDLQIKALDVRTDYESTLSEILKLVSEEVKP